MNTREKIESFTEKTEFALYVEKKSFLETKSNVYLVGKRHTREESLLQMRRKNNIAIALKISRKHYIENVQKKVYVQDVGRERLLLERKNAGYVLIKTQKYTEKEHTERKVLGNTEKKIIFAIIAEMKLTEKPGRFASHVGRDVENTGRKALAEMNIGKMITK